MPYRFNFDLTKVSRPLFREIAKISARRGLHLRLGDIAKSIVEGLRIQELTGLPVADAVELVKDIMDVYLKNLEMRESFLRTSRRALLLPHCARKYMDSRCRASFSMESSSFSCAKCSEDCLINRAMELGRRRGYDVYVLPGGSCIGKVLSKGGYDGVVGVACSEEAKLAMAQLEGLNVKGQAVLLVRNGCAATSFNLRSLEEVL
ncbi:MAG: DUF116 domain-containing protein [Candidatus Bathyarchaeia archaeon]